jgi:hypothetical protein
VAGLTAWLVLLAAALPGGPWREAPEHLPLVAPAGPRRAAWRTYVSTSDLDAVLARLKGHRALLAAPGAWEPRPQLPLDAFGQTGRYDRWKLARLYGAARPRVARGPVGSAGAVTGAWTLVSPYPNGELSRLEAGTLLIVLSLSAP